MNVKERVIKSIIIINNNIASYTHNRDKDRAGSEGIVRTQDKVWVNYL